MRILVLLPSLLDSIGGIQTYSQALVWALSDVVGTASGTVRVLALHDLPGEERSIPGLDAVRLRGFGGKRLAFSLAAVAEARRADTVILAHVNFSPLLHPIRWFSPGARTYVSAHGIDVWRPLGSAKLSALRHVTAIWPVSDYTRQRMLMENPSLRNIRFDVLPNTLGPSAGTVAATPHGASQPPGKVVLCVSRMAASEPYKNVEKLIRAMPDVLARQPDTTLVIVGPGDDRPRLEGISQSLGLGQQIRFMGRVSDAELQSHFAACDLFVLPSTGEGFGIVYLEAMQYGKACIGARAAAVPEVIEDGVTGLLVDPEKPEQLSAGIIRLLQDDALRVQMGEQGRRRLEEKFSMPAFRRRLEALLRR